MTHRRDTHTISMTPTSRVTTASTSTRSCPEAHRDDPRVERTRTAVIDAAVELLKVKGPSAVTHANVANAANVSRTTAYKHWPTRADLLRATIGAIEESTPQLITLTGETRTDLELLLRHIVRGLEDDQQAPLMAAMMERALHDPTVRAVRDGLMAEFSPVFRTVIESAIDTGEIRSDIDIDIALASIVGSFLFIRFMSSQAFDTDLAGRILDEFIATNKAV